MTSNLNTVYGSVARVCEASVERKADYFSFSSCVAAIKLFIKSWPNVAHSKVFGKEKERKTRRHNGVLRTSTIPQKGTLENCQVIN